MPSLDFAIATKVRQVLAHHWIDLRTLEYRVQDGTVHVAGELRYSDKAHRVPDAWSVADVERDLWQIRGVRDLRFRLTNWVQRPTGGWQAPHAVAR